jgi:hypothetical protein
MLHIKDILVRKSRKTGRENNPDDGFVNKELKRIIKKRPKLKKQS